MGLFGAFTLLLPLFLRGRSVSRHAREPAKCTTDKASELHELERGTGNDKRDRGNLHGDRSSDDITLSESSLYSRIKSYVWPSDDNSADLDRIIPNYRWTPILSGIVIPFSILLEIPGLTERWYIRTEDHKTVETKKNPVILEVGLAISIACALVANVALVLRFLEKRVQTVTLICIVSLTVHDVINIVTVTVFGVEHRFDDGFTYGEAFWMTLCSTIASTVSNVTLIVDFVRTPDFSRRGSGLTRKQRALMIIVIVLLVYIALGALINSILLHLSFINGLYFSVVSIETIGFGDIAPQSTGARVWTCVYVLFGVINIGVAIAMCRETILEGLEISYRKRMRGMRQRRRDGRRFRRWEARWQRAVEFRLREAGLPIWVSDNGERDVRLANSVQNESNRIPLLQRLRAAMKSTTTLNSVDARLGGHRGMHLNVDALTDAQLEAAALEAGVPLETFFDVSRRRHKQRRGVAQLEKSDDVIPALARTHAAHAFHSDMRSGWPSHAQTPTHAQTGRMAAMLTKFAVAIAGRYANVPGRGSEIASETREEEVEEAGEGDDPPSQPENDNGGRTEAPAVNRNHGDRPPNQGPRISILDTKRHSAGQWLKDHSRGATQRSAWDYERLQTEMDAEEKKAYYVKLTIAWSLFFLFWTVGSGIFTATEGWPYGTAMYFCFLAFLTTGYGDFAPATPAGRSVFVVWALFGVGTLTIVVSVLQEAGSSRYKSALHSRVFDKAVNKYRRRQLQEGKKRPRPVTNKRDSLHRDDERKGFIPDSNRPASSRQHDQNSVERVSEQLRESQEIARRALEALPGEIVSNARTFQEYMRFFVTGTADGVTPYDEREPEQLDGQPTVPPDMRKLLDELAEMEHINERVKSEILQDDDARKTLFMLCLERSLKNLVASAERALAALADRDALVSIAAAQHPSEPGGDSGRSTAVPSPRAHSEPAPPIPYQRTARQPTDEQGPPSSSDLGDVSPTSAVAIDTGVPS